MRRIARPAQAATILALLLAVGGALLPAAAPAIPVPAAVRPPVALAADDIEITTAARYTVDPEARKVRVVVDVTAVNRKPNRTIGTGVTRFFYDGVNLGVQPEARGFRATQGGSPVRVQTAKRDGYRLLTILFTENLYFGETARIRLAFNLPAGAPRSASDVRVGAAFATFTAWAFGDTGRVRIEIPSDFRVEIAGEAMDAEPGRDGLQAWSARTSDPPAWYAWVNATNEAGLTSDRLSLEGGQEVVIRAWPEDDRWRSRVRVLLRDGLPQLSDRIGLPWPVDGELLVTEVHTPLLEGYAGFYDPATDEITISEELDDLTIVHEASHAWFDSALFTERWITEGLADEYAARTLRADDRGYPGPDRVTRRDPLAFALNDWPPPSAIRDEEAGDRERYGYAASWTVMRRIVSRVGEDGMREVFAAADAGTTAYPGEGAAERSRLPNDWRRFLDLAEQAAGPAAEEGGRTLAGLVEQWALAPSEAALLPLRAEALAAYDPLVARGGTWAAPRVVRLALDAWHFNDAIDAADAAAGVLVTRDEIETLADAEGLRPAAILETRYQDASSIDDLASVAQEAERSLAVLGGLAAAADAAALPRDWLSSWGLEGADPDARLAAGQAAWESGDLDAAEDAAEAVVRDLAGASDAGRTKAAIVSFGLAAGLGLLLVALLLARGRRRSRRRPGATWVPDDGDVAVSAAMPSATPPEWPGPYATLPPDGPPAPPGGRPPSRDEGAERP